MSVCASDASAPVTTRIQPKQQPYMNKRLPPPPVRQQNNYEGREDPPQRQSSYQMPYQPSVVTMNNLRSIGNGTSFAPALMPSQNSYYERPEPKPYITEEEDEALTKQEYAENLSLYAKECEDVLTEMKDLIDKRRQRVEELQDKMNDQATHSENLLRLNHIGYFPNDIDKPKWNTIGGRLTLNSLNPGSQNTTEFQVLLIDANSKGEIAFGVEKAETRLKNAVLAEVNVKYFRNHTPVSLAVKIYRKYRGVKKLLEITGSHCFNINERCHFLSHAESTITQVERIFKNDPSANHVYANLFPELSSDLASIERGVEFAGNERRVPQSHVILRFLADHLHLKKYKAKGWVWPNRSVDHGGYYLLSKKYFDDIVDEISIFVEENFPVTDLTSLSFEFVPTIEMPFTEYENAIPKNYIDFSIQLLYGLRGTDMDN